MKKLSEPLIRLFESPLSAGALAFGVYAIFALQAGPIWRTTDYAYFNYLADAFLHRQLFLRVMPPNVHDLALYNGHYYLYWPPFPAILLMPFVALFGVNFSDVLFTLILASVNVGIVAYFFRLLSAREYLVTTHLQRAILVSFFAFGTAHFIIARWGRVWFTSQVIALLCSLLAYVVVMRFHRLSAFFLSGLLLSCAMLTRNHLIFLGIWPAYYLFKQHNHLGWKKLIGLYLAFISPLIISLVFYAGYNWLRFGTVFEIGTTYQDLGDFFRSDFKQYGIFSLHYVPINFYYNFVYYPFPVSDKTLLGGSLFLLSPTFFAAFRGMTKSQLGASAWLLALTIFAVTIPILVNIGTGWATFGPRYTLDFAPPLLILTAAGVTHWDKRVLLLLTVVSIVHYFIGSIVVWFYP